MKAGAALIRRQLKLSAGVLNLKAGSSFSAPLLMAENVPAVFLARQKPVLVRVSPQLGAQSVFPTRTIGHVNSHLTLKCRRFVTTYFSPFTDAKNRLSNFNLNTLSLNIGGTGGVQTDHGGRRLPDLVFSAQLNHGFSGTRRLRYELLSGGTFSGAIFALETRPTSIRSRALRSRETCGTKRGRAAVGKPSPLDSPCSPCLSGTRASSTLPQLADSALSPKQTKLAWQPYLEQYNLEVQKQIGANVSYGRLRGIARETSGNEQRGATT